MANEENQPPADLDNQDPPQEKDLVRKYRDIWSRLGINQKVSLVLSFGFVFAGMVLMLVWASRPRMEILYRNLEPQDMASVTTILEENNHKYTISETGSTIYVEADSVHQVRMLLASADLPQSGEIGFEIFDRSNFGVSNFVQHTNFLRAVQGELARTIAQMDKIQRARVMVVMPENRLLVTNENVKPSASVFIETQTRSLGKDAVNAIRHLVANAVEGLELANVAVIDNKGNVLSEALDQDSSLDSAAGKLKYRHQLENYLSRKVEVLLGKALGAQNVIVTVSADINTAAQTQIEERFDPKSQVARTHTTTEDSTTTTTQKLNQPVGAESNVVQNEPNGNERKKDEEITSEHRRNETVNYEINAVRTETIINPGEVRSLTAAVFLDTPSQTDEEGNIVPQPRSERELKGIRNIVANALGLPIDSPATSRQITIQEMPFVQEPIIQSASIFDFRNNLYFWLSVLRNLGSLLVALIIFAIFFRMIKHQRSNIPSFEVVDDGPSGTNAQPASTEKAEQAAQLPLKSTPKITPDMLNDLIQDKPENVSIALKNWVAGSTKGHH